MKPIPAKGRVRYPAASAMQTRASVDEAQSDDDAATSLEPPKFVDWRVPEPLPPEAAPVSAPVPSEGAALVTTRTSELVALRPDAPAASRAPAVVGWVAIAVLGVLSGLAGALIGIWLAGGGG